MKDKKKKCGRFLLLGSVLTLLLCLGVNAIETTYTYNEVFQDVTIGTYNTVANTGSNIKFGGFSAVKWNTTNKLTLNTTATLTNGSTTTLILSNIIDNLVVTNTSNSVLLDAGNYTLANATGIITWSLSGDGMQVWKGQTITILWNKTVAANDAIDTDLYTATGASGYSVPGQIKLSLPTGTTWNTATANGLDLNTTYSYLTSDIAASCNATKSTIFAAFGLLAIIIIVGGGWLLVSMFNGGLDSGGIMAAIIGFIALGITILVGYIIISNVTQSLCV